MSNYFTQYRDSNKHLKKFTATQFTEVWQHYDSDGNGYIEGTELEHFLQEFFADAGIKPDELDKMKKDFLKKYDENSDNKIELNELAQILPMDESFLLLFRNDNPVQTSCEFMQLWKRFDKDNSGFIETGELDDFLMYMLNSNKKGGEITPEKLSEYRKMILQLFDQNGDGKLQLSEMARLLPVKNNVLANPIFRDVGKITDKNIEDAFRHYDRDGNGTIEDEELDGFLKDLLSATKASFTQADLQKLKQCILKEWDVNHDGKINHDELKMLLNQQRRACEQ